VSNPEAWCQLILRWAVVNLSAAPWQDRRHTWFSAFCDEIQILRHANERCSLSSRQGLVRLARGFVCKSIASLPKHYDITVWQEVTNHPPRFLMGLLPHRNHSETFKEIKFGSLEILGRQHWSPNNATIRWRIQKHFFNGQTSWVEWLECNTWVAIKTRKIMVAYHRFWKHT